MIEYRIEVPATIEFVKDLWKRFFQKDNKWHYTLEGNYVEIRVEKKIPALDKYLQKKKIEYITFKYKDNIPITRKYQPQFEKIFHGFTDLAMKVDRRGKYVDRVFERCVHLAANILGLNLWDEAFFLAPYSINRAHHAGEESGKKKFRKWLIETDKKEVYKYINDQKKTRKK